jgi:hypothetical protein
LLAEGAHILKRILFLCVCSLLSLLAVSCSSSSKMKTTPPPPGTQSGVQFISPTSSPSIDAGQAVTITANQPVMWSLQTSFGQPVGTLSNTTTAATSVTYTAPSSVPSTAQATVVATSASDSTQSASVIVFVNPLVAFDTSSHLTPNADCSYDPVQGTNNGTVGSTYAFSGATTGPLKVAGGTGPYTWTLASGSGSLPVGLSLGSLPQGSLSCSSGCAFLFGKPASVGCSHFQIEITDSTGITATSPTYYVVITPTALKIQAPNYSDWYQDIPYPPTPFTVSGGTPPYIWSQEAEAPLPANLTLNNVTNNSAAAFIAGTPTTSPTVPPTLMVTDAQTPYPAVGTVTLNQGLDLPQPPCTPVQGTGTFNSGLLGTYSFLLRGFDANGPVVVAGSFAADGNGNVLSGVEDITRSTSSGSQANVAVSGSYSVFQQQGGNSPFRQVGCVTLTGTAGTNTFVVSLGGCSGLTDPLSGECLPNSQGVAGVFTTGRIMEFDDTGTRVAGILRMQDTSTFSAGLTGSYAFGLSGWDSAGSRYAAAGSVNSSSGSLSSAAADINDGGILQSALTGGAEPQR